MHHAMDPRNAPIHHQQQSPQDATRKVFTGKVTKILDTFGFIDNDVFFQPTVVRGGPAKVGDSVYVECQYSEHLPFKWNATRVQVLSADSSAASGNKQQPVVSSSYVPQPVALASSPMSHNSTSGSSIQPRDDPRQVIGNNYWQSGSSGSNAGSNSGPAFAGASRNPVFVSEYTQQNTNQDPNSQPLQPTGPSGHPHFTPFGANGNFPPAAVNNGNSVTYTTTPGSAFLSTQIQPPFDPSVSAIGPPGPFGPGTGGGGVGPGGVVGGGVGVGVGGGPGPQHSGPVRENRTSRWEPRESRGSGPVHRDSDDRRRHDRRDIRLERERKDGKDEFGRDRPPVDRESRNARFNERQREKSVSPGSNTGSVSSRYESKSENLPKFQLLESSLSSLDIKTRYGSKIHIPSDFETLLVNEDFEMDLNSIPKPIRYKIHEARKRKESSSSNSKKSSSEKEKEKEKEKENRFSKESKESKEIASEKKTKDSSSFLPSQEEPSPSPSCSLQESQVTSESVKEEKSTEESSDSSSKRGPVKIEQQSTTRSSNAGTTSSATSTSTTTATTSTTSTCSTSTIGGSNSELLVDTAQVKQENNCTDVNSEQSDAVKYNGPKHGVKVILLSLPEMNAIFEKVFGYDFERQTSTGYYYPLNKLISFLAFRNQNDGYSLLGGKFNVQLDGFIGEKPNLIATAIRSVKEQTGIDLSPCSRWISLGSFVYNRDDSLNERPSIEYSTVFMPDVWTLLDCNSSFTSSTCTSTTTTSALTSSTTTTTTGSSTSTTTTTTTSSEDSQVTPASSLSSKQEESSSSHQVLINESQASHKSETGTDISTGEVNAQQQQQQLLPKEELDKLDELKVVELKSKLDSLGVKYSRTLKKAELLSLLKEHISGQSEIQSTATATQTAAAIQDEPMNTDSVDLPPPSTLPLLPPPPPAPSVETEQQQTSESAKRKFEPEPNVNEPPNKKVAEETKVEKPLVNKEKVIDVTGDFSFSLLTLHQALNHHKHDHFELSICAELIRESLIRSFGYYIASTLKENTSNLKTVESPSTDRRKIRAPNFLQLVFCYFDEKHLGEIRSDDLLIILLHSGFKISKKSWLSLICNCEKIQYKNLEPPVVILKAPKIKSPLVESSSTTSTSSSTSSSSTSNSSSSSASSVIVRDGVLYNLDNLIEQGNKFSKAQIQLQGLSEKLDEREKQVCDFETKQKKMTSAIEKQNDEICALKREKESLKIKIEELKKFMISVRDSFKKQEELLQS